jgi:hypothetical protein
MQEEAAKRILRHTGKNRAQKKRNMSSNASQAVTACKAGTVISAKCVHKVAGTSTTNVRKFVHARKSSAFSARTVIN